MKDPKNREPIVDYLLREGGSGAGEKGPCPDEVVLVRAAEGRLEPDERADTEAHLVACDTCCAVVASVSNALSEATPASTSGGDMHGGAARSGTIRRLTWGAAVAAAAVVTVFILFKLNTRRPRSTSEQLLAVAKTFGFTPLDRDALRDARAPVLRGTVRGVFPQGKTLSTRPIFRWRGTSTTGVHVRVIDATTGKEVWRASATGSILPYPPAEPPFAAGAPLLWKVAADGAFAATTGTLFTVVTDGERREAEVTLADIDRRASTSIRNLVAAHYALRQGYLDVAEERARSFHEAAPTDTLGRDTLNYVLRKLGIEESRE